MLRELFIKKFAVIDELRVELHEGLNVLTGETGAGKSIVVDALGLILGQRGQSNFIKTGAKETVVEAIFDAVSVASTEALGIDVSEELIIRRVVSSTGKNRSFINDSSVGIATVTEIGSTLVDIHSQHENQSLMSKSRQMRLLDSFGRTEDAVKDYSITLGRYRAMLDERARLAQNISNRDKRIEILRFQIDEITAADLDAKEAETLSKERAVLANLTTLKELSEGAYEVLHKRDGAMEDQSAVVVDSLEKLTKIDESASEILSMAKETQSYIKELSVMLRRYKDNIDFVPERLDTIETRLEAIRKLERKYGETVEVILNYRDSAVAELDELTAVNEKLDSIEAEIASARKRLEAAAEDISKQRAVTARRLESEIASTLKVLAMPKARLEISLTLNRNEDGSLKLLNDGADTVEFLFTANPGEPLKQLQKIASGGELSRVMLALKSAFAEYDDIPVLVFDEVDAGIGGETAERVADKLKELSKRRQVLCVTHLPQIASRADNHLMIHKHVSDDAVAITVETLYGQDRQVELARMLSGSITDISLEHARELLKKGGDV
ncbi:DNA repair protein RecN [Candidatus Magnetominusculus xianensis]|uniref:DNA repair protein RecN n=1 Tax=Candidatus Magnetominusculus xianensis TaxID=1748249 RepID=A0ABR5SBL5_9BACT|nr:DNA repair protein RecN [Candidatus Magnetominusculus xianensis]KWT78174.1 DNA repair protein RecN [Candidatus Magnetominusculus xianensis]MBF0404689.1 DNA repair protein RecN [Nitrospirota bacterium]